METTTTQAKKKRIAVVSGTVTERVQTRTFGNRRRVMWTLTLADGSTISYTSNLRGNENATATGYPTYVLR